MQNTSRNGRGGESGAVSIFIVIFFALLIGVITLSFIGIVTRDATQSTNNDLSRSAYDSAQSGIEDAKRAIAATLNACNSGGPCDTYKGYLADKQCNALPSFSGVLGLSTPKGKEIPVANSANDASLDQAYTCVNVTMNTPDYVSSKGVYQSDIVPLNAADASGNPATPDTVTVNWFAHADAPGMSDTDAFTPRRACSVSPGGTDCQLPQESAWDEGGAPYTPSLLRVQLISYTDGAITDADLTANTRTLFLYPVRGGVTTASFALNTVPADAASAPPIVPVSCGGSARFACSVKLSLGTAAGQSSLLRVTPVYKKATFQLELGGGGGDLLFNGVQPIVDSTGRANDLFRRVQARVRMQNSVVYPEYAVDIENSLCKNFSVGSDDRDFDNRCPIN